MLKCLIMTIATTIIMVIQVKVEDNLHLFGTILQEEKKYLVECTKVHALIAILSGRMLNQEFCDNI